MIAPMKKTWVAWSIDWACQVAINEFRDLIRKRAAMGFNLAVSYAAPGPGKMIWNRYDNAHEAYSDRYNLIPNEPYWAEVDKRLKILNDNGITAVMSYSFVDQGLFNPRVINQSKIIPDLIRIGERYKDYSVIWSPVSEAEEGGAEAVKRTKEIVFALREVVRPDPIGFHSVSDNSRFDWINYISIQDHGSLDVGRLKRIRDKYPNVPAIVVECQKCSDANTIASMRQAHALGGTFTCTSRNWSISDWLAGEISEFAREVS